MAATEQATCNHIKTNGSICKAVALQDEDYCYFHHRERQRLYRLSATCESIQRTVAAERLMKFPRTKEMQIMYADECAATMNALQLPTLEDAEAIQVVLTSVVRALATQQIDFRAAGLMLYAVQIASGNLRRLRTVPDSQFNEIALNDPEPLFVPDAPREAVSKQ
jgi:hypothetical protein